MHRYFKTDDIDRRTGMIEAALVVGKIHEIRPKSGELCIQLDSGEIVEIRLHMKIFGDHSYVDVLGARVVYSVLDTVDFDLDINCRDLYRDHEVLCILDGVKAGTMLEYKDERQP